MNGNGNGLVRRVLLGVLGLVGTAGIGAGGWAARRVIGNSDAIALSAARISRLEEAQIGNLRERAIIVEANEKEKRGLHDDVHDLKADVAALKSIVNELRRQQRR